MTVGCAVLGATLAVELGLRAFVLSPVATFTHPTLGRLMRPHTFYRETTEGGSAFVTNKLGFNDIDPPASASGGIVVVGDSYVEAAQVPRDENFASDFRRLHPDEPILSAGRDGLSPLSYKYLLDYVRPAFPPRFVVVVLNHSDIQDIRESRVKVDRSPSGEIVALADRENQRPGGAEADSFRYLVAHSSIFALLNQRYIETFKAAVAAVRSAPRQLAGLFSTRAATPPGGESGSDRTLSDEELIGIASLLLKELQAEAPVGVVYVPLFEYKSGGRTTESPRSSEARALFSQAASRAGIPFVDLGPALLAEFRKTGNPPVGFANTAPGEGHLNVTGSELLARAIGTLTARQTETGAAGKGS